MVVMAGSSPSLVEAQASALSLPAVPLEDDGGGCASACSCCPWLRPPASGLLKLPPSFPSPMDEGVGDTEFLSELDGVTSFPEAGAKRGGNPAM